jgi:hypothetical protein
MVSNDQHGHWSATALVSREDGSMALRRHLRWLPAAMLPVSLAFQPVLALGDTPAPGATPEAPERRESIDPDFVVKIDGDVDPGFVVRWGDTSNDAGFVVGPEAIAPGPAAPAPTPPAGTPAPKVITLGAP